MFPHWPTHAEDEIAAAVRVLRSGRTNQWTGPDVHDFEDAFAKYIGVDHALAVSNGTFALELALRGLGIGSGDKVLVTSRSFVASASAPMLVGAVPVFADVDECTGNVTADTLEAAWSPDVCAVIVVHLAGLPCRMASIVEWAEKRNVLLIEDCAQAHGASVNGKRVGSFGDSAAFSFCQDKIMTTGGEGGMTLFTNREAFEQAWSWRDHGKVWQELFGAIARPVVKHFRWVADELGTNGRLTGTQAALGHCQLGKLDDWIAKRSENAHTFRDCVVDVPWISIPWPSNEVVHAWYQLPCLIEADSEYQLRDRLLDRLIAEGWPVRSGPCPEIYREQVFASQPGLPMDVLPNAASLGCRSIMVPVHPSADAADMKRLASAIIQAGRACLAS